MIILLKYCADKENCESFRGFSFIYILVLYPCNARLNQNSNVNKFFLLIYLKLNYKIDNKNK